MLTASRGRECRAEAGLTDLRNAVAQGGAARSMRLVITLQKYSDFRGRPIQNDTELWLKKGAIAPAMYG